MKYLIWLAEAAAFIVGVAVMTVVFSVWPLLCWNGCDPLVTYTFLPLAWLYQPIFSSYDVVMYWDTNGDGLRHFMLVLHAVTFLSLLTLIIGVSLRRWKDPIVLLAAVFLILQLVTIGAARAVVRSDAFHHLSLENKYGLTLNEAAAACSLDRSQSYEQCLTDQASAAASAEEGIALCRLVEPRSVQGCLQALAVRRGEPELCDLATDWLNERTNEECRSLAAEFPGLTTVPVVGEYCAAFSFVVDRIRCFGVAAAKFKDPSLCDRSIPAIGGIRENCLSVMNDPDWRSRWF